MKHANWPAGSSNERGPHKEHGEIRNLLLYRLTTPHVGSCPEILISALHPHWCDGKATFHAGFAITVKPH